MKEQEIKGDRERGGTEVRKKKKVKHKWWRKTDRKGSKSTEGTEIKKSSMKIEVEREETNKRYGRT